MKTLMLIMIALFLTGCTGTEEMSDFDFSRNTTNLNLKPFLDTNNI